MNRTELIEAIIKKAPKYADGFILREVLLRLGDYELINISNDMNIQVEPKKESIPLGVVK